MKPKPHARRKARALALQALYQWQLNIDSIPSIKVQFIEKTNSNKVDAGYFNDLLEGTIKDIGLIDETIAPFLEPKFLVSSNASLIITL